MADINLIGNDHGGSERRGRGDEHYEEPSEFNPAAFDDGSFGGFQETGFDSSDPYMDQSYGKKTSKSVMYILIGACVVLFVLLLYLLTTDDEPDKGDAAKTKTQETQTEQTAPPPLHGPNQEMLTRVDAIINSFPQELKLSVFRYSQGEFIIESQARKNEPLDELTNRLKQAVPGIQIKEDNKTKSSISSDRIGLLSGGVPQTDIWSQPGQLSGLNYIGESEFRSRVQNHVTSSNLQLKDYFVGRTKAENNFRITMIRVKVAGDRAAAASFLHRLNDDKINVNFTKIVFLASERKLDDPTINLIVEIELFRKMS